MKTIITLVLLIGINYSQTIYEVTPGKKGNEIKLTVANVSETNPAANVNIKPPQPLLRRGFQEEIVTFHQSEQSIEILNPKEEREVTFTFDVKRNAPINKKDTIDFVITSSDGIMMTKQFVFNYTGPKEFKLEQNFPNPFNPTTRIQYQVSSISEVSLKVYDILGSEVKVLVNEQQEPGYYEVQFNGSNYASGMYVYRLQAENYAAIKKMLMIK